MSDCDPFGPGVEHPFYLILCLDRGKGSVSRCLYPETGKVTVTRIASPASVGIEKHSDAGTEY